MIKAFCTVYGYFFGYLPSLSISLSSLGVAGRSNASLSQQRQKGGGANFNESKGHYRKYNVKNMPKGHFVKSIAAGKHLKENNNKKTKEGENILI
jgi:hypothetical protein